MPQIDVAQQEIHYIEKGSGDTFLIFPDNLHSSAAYADEMEHFADGFQVLSFDYPGRGESTREVRYRDEREVDLWGHFADFACHLLMELGIEGCYVLGSGLGALAALHFAGKQAKQHGLEAMGVIADSFQANLDARTLHRWLDTREHYYVRNAKALQEQHGDDWRQVVDADTVFLRRLADRGGYEVQDAVLNAIPCPTLLTGHVRDPVTPHIAGEFARLSALIPDCTVYLASGAGHPYIEHPWSKSNPDAFRALSALFLSRGG